MSPAKLSFPFTSRFPARQIGKVLAHVEGRCRARCTYCAKLRKAHRVDQRVGDAIEATLQLLQERVLRSMKRKLKQLAA